MRTTRTSSRPVKAPTRCWSAPSLDASQKASWESSTRRSSRSRPGPWFTAWPRFGSVAGSASGFAKRIPIALRTEFRDSTSTRYFARCRASVISMRGTKRPKRNMYGSMDPKLTHLLKVARASRPLPGPHGGLAFASNSEGYHKTMFLDGPQGEPRTLADCGDRTLPHAWTEFGLLVRHDRGGSEIWQLSMVGADKALRALTTDSKAIHQSVTLHPDRRRVGLGWNAGGGRDVSLGELDLENGELRAWATPGDFWYWEDWSPDGKKAAVNKVFGSWTEAHIMERDGSMVRVLPDARRVSEISWTTNGMFMLTDAGDSDFMGLAEVDPERPDVVRRWLIHEEHDVEGYVVDHSGQRAIVVVNQGVYDETRIVDLADGVASDRAGWKNGVVLFDLSGPQSYHMNWSQDGRSVFASLEHPTHPAEIYEWPADRRWTKINEDGGYSRLVEPVETSYRSFDGLEIHSLFYQKDTK